jgi:ubiquinone biosynthesis protein
VFIVFPERENPLTPGELNAMNRRSELRPALTPLTKVEQEAREQAAPPLEGPEEFKLALIDFGMTARLTDAMRDEVVRLLLDISENRGEEAAETMAGIGDPVEDFDRHAYTRDVAALIGQTADRTIGDLQAGIVMYEMINISFRHGLRMPAELTLLAKALFNLDAVSRALDPSFSPIDAIRDYTTEIANERARRTLSPQRLYRLTTEAADLLSALPRRLDDISKRIADNEFSMRVDAPQLPILLEGMQKIANRIFMGLALAGLLVASGLVLQYWRVMGLVGFVVSGALALWMVVTVIVSDRKNDRH